MTLLEVLLALGLTGVVMVVISMAIHLHLITVDTRRADIEQAQVARGVLQHIAADIRNTVWYEPLDMSSLADMTAVPGSSGDSGSPDPSSGQEAAGGQEQEGQSEQQSPGQQDSQSGGGESESEPELDMGSLDLLGDMGLDTTEPSENTMDIAGTVEPTSAPGLYGNQFELRVDCSRLPRVDQYSAMYTETSGGVAPSIPSDVKSVSYFLQNADSSQGSVTSPTGGTAMGLVRREMDRAAASFSAQDGSLDASEHPGSLLAAEVNYLEFRYWDGSSWYTEWDSEQMGGLPAAIEITIGIDPAAGQNLEEMDVKAANDLAAADMNEYMYRLTVHLPVAKPLVTDEYMDLTGEGSTGTLEGAVP
ncbi:MAG: type II secretion system protein GspJ [Pirellulaceae bacterium]|nr:type II secretion system protein GspJ [Pirellulaceae bacterium]